MKCQVPKFLFNLLSTSWKNKTFFFFSYFWRHFFVRPQHLNAIVLTLVATILLLNLEKFLLDGWCLVTLSLYNYDAYRGGIKNIQNKCTASLLEIFATGLEIRRASASPNWNETREKNLNNSLRTLAYKKYLHLLHITPKTI